jgi:hypothetical protein
MNSLCTLNSLSTMCPQVLTQSSDITTVNNSNVYMQTGQSGATANGFPTYYTGTYPYVYFNNSGTATLSANTQALQSNGTLTNVAFTTKSVYVVCMMTADTGTGVHKTIFMDDSTTSKPFCTIYLPQTSNTSCTVLKTYDLYKANLNFVKNYQLTYPSNAILSLNTKIIFSYVCSSSNGALIHINGNTANVSDSSTWTNVTSSNIKYNRVTIGGGYDSTCWTGQFYEVLYYTDYHDWTTMRTIESQLATKWGVSGWI